MNQDIINETRCGEWIVVDGRDLRNSTFIDCVLELSTGTGRSMVVCCTFDGCDLVGPWPLHPLQCQADQTVHVARHEPEVMTLLSSDASRSVAEALARRKRRWGLW